VSDGALRMLRISCDGDSWLAIDGDGAQIRLGDVARTETGEMRLPALPAGCAARQLLLPAEWLLCRTFSLPLASPRFIDQEILAQELEEHTAEDAADWWLCWQAGRDGDGVSGVMFGMPESLRCQIDGDALQNDEAEAGEARGADGVSDEAAHTEKGGRPDHDPGEEGGSWSQLQSVGIDLLARLDARLAGERSASERSDFKPTALSDAAGAIALFDADASGLCFGVWQPCAGDGDGFWCGMRRLNLAGQAWQALAEEVMRTLQAMGWRGGDSASDSATVSDIAAGSLPESLADALSERFGAAGWRGERVAVDALPTRHQANLALASVGSADFRHGRWRAATDFGEIRPWYRTLALAGLLALVWIGGQAWQNYQLEQQTRSAQQRVIQAFHQGLPQQRVIIDALAQLRKAAGGSGEAANDSAAAWLRQLDAVAQVYRTHPWRMRELAMRNGRMTMAGQVSDLQAMNAIRAALEQQYFPIHK